MMQKEVNIILNVRLSITEPRKAIPTDVAIQIRNLVLAQITRKLAWCP